MGGGNCLGRGMEAGRPGWEGRRHTCEQLRAWWWGWWGGEEMRGESWKSRNGSARFGGLSIRRMGWDGSKE